MRHTCAASLVSAGMNPLALMILFGHVDARDDDARYAAMADVTVRSAYDDAMTKLGRRTTRRSEIPDQRRRPCRPHHWLQSKNAQDPRRPRLLLRAPGPRNHASTRVWASEQARQAGVIVSLETHIRRLQRSSGNHRTG